MNSVEDQWKEFEEKVIPHNAPTVQRVEMRKAFFAGAYSFLMMTTAVLGNESMSEDSGVALLESWREECETAISAYAHNNSG